MKNYPNSVKDSPFFIEFHFMFMTRFILTHQVSLLEIFNCITEKKEKHFILDDKSSLVSIFKVMEIKLLCLECG